LAIRKHGWKKKKKKKEASSWSPKKEKVRPDFTKKLERRKGKKGPIPLNEEGKKKILSPNQERIFPRRKAQTAKKKKKKKKEAKPAGGGRNFPVA